MKARIRELLQAQPFQPFIIRMADGRWYQIEHPDFVLAGPGELTPVILEQLDGAQYSLSALLITSVDMVPQKAA